MEQNSIWKDLQSIKKEKPLIHYITNYMVMTTTANVLLVVGASPVMAHAIEKSGEFAKISEALVINMETLSIAWIDSMIAAGKIANENNVPRVFDPVGAGATNFRTNTVKKILENIHPAVIHGIASEIKSILHSNSAGKGVDSNHQTIEVLDDAITLSKKLNCIISVSGATDLIVSEDFTTQVHNEHPILASVTGMGCNATAITGAFLTINSNYFYASVHAMAIMGITGEMATAKSDGPGSFQMNFIDML